MQGVLDWAEVNPNQKQNVKMWREGVEKLGRNFCDSAGWAWFRMVDLAFQRFQLNGFLSFLLLIKKQPFGEIPEAVPK